jgi:hypothetical protein
MPGFKKLKLIKDALNPDAIRQGLAASRSGPTEEQLAALTPAQRAAYHAAMAQAAAASALRTLWRPAIWSRKFNRPARVFASTRQ